MEGLLQAQELVAVFFEELTPVLEGKPAVPAGEHGEEELSPVAQALYCAGKFR